MELKRSRDDLSRPIGPRRKRVIEGDLISEVRMDGCRVIKTILINIDSAKKKKLWEGMKREREKGCDSSIGYCFLLLPELLRADSEKRRETEKVG